MKFSSSHLLSWLACGAATGILCMVQPGAFAQQVVEAQLPAKETPRQSEGAREGGDSIRKAFDDAETIYIENLKQSERHIQSALDQADVAARPMLETALDQVRESMGQIHSSLAGAYYALDQAGDLRQRNDLTLTLDNTGYAAEDAVLDAMEPASEDMKPELYSALWFIRRGALECSRTLHRGLFISGVIDLPASYQPGAAVQGSGSGAPNEVLYQGLREADFVILESAGNIQDGGRQVLEEAMVHIRNSARILRGAFGRGPYVYERKAGEPWSREPDQGEAPDLGKTASDFNARAKVVEGMDRAVDSIRRGMSEGDSITHPILQGCVDWISPVKDRIKQSMGLVATGSGKQDDHEK